MINFHPREGSVNERVLNRFFQSFVNLENCPDVSCDTNKKKLILGGIEIGGGDPYMLVNY
jgi:hypothetical protein